MFLELCVLAVEHSFVSDVEMTFGFFTSLSAVLNKANNVKH